MNETITRLISGVVYIMLLFTATIYSPVTFYIFFGFVMVVSIVEFCKLINLNYAIPILIGLLLFGLQIVLSTKNIDGFQFATLFGGLFVSVLLLKNLFSKKTLFLDKNFKYVLVIGYIIFPFLLLTSLPFVASIGYDYKIIFVLFVLIWSNDTFAYIVGKSIGKRKLLPEISPKKTIEGFLGGFIFTILAGVAIHEIMNIFTSTFLILMAVLISVFGTIGDLVESKFKRLAQVKDSGKIMPGHGGILDRFDSVIFVAPFILLLIKIFTYVS